MVLGVLAVRRGRVVMPGQIADAVWGERPPASWPKQVQICVARLRKVLGPAAIESATGGYRLVVTGDEVDVDRFERLVEDGRALVATGQPHRAASSFAAALALWRGTPFEDLVEWEPGCSESTRLDQLRLSAEEELLDARLAAGEHVAVAADAEPLVASEPLRERRWEILVTAQYRCGRQAEALRSLARVRRLLVEQLGVDPGPGLVELETAILHHDGSLAPPPPAAPLMATCPYKGLAAYETADAEGFFGRAAEVSACIDRLRETTLLVVTGPSGCGKSSLLRAGLVPALLRVEQPVVTFVPGSDPDAAMSEALAGAVGRPTLVIDQFEELFTLAAVDAGQVFCRRVARYAQDAPVIIGVRADHVAGLSVDPQLAAPRRTGHVPPQPALGGDLA